MHNSAWMGACVFISQCVRVCVCTVHRGLTCLLCPSQLHVLVSLGISGALIWWGALLLALERTSFFS